jgi:hypothetical protein
MNALRHDLWRRLTLYSLDDIDAQLPFSKRLARDNNWTLDYAKRVMEEYKKFVFLALTSNHPVTPSDEIDQVWHLHLVYTENYWDNFCDKVLHQKLHHSPTKGGREEGKKFHRWYAQTKTAYRDAFDCEPPDDIWLEEKVRFGSAPHFKRINAKANWIIPKSFGKIALTASAFITGLAFISSCSSEESEGQSLLGIIALITLGIISIFCFKRFKAGSNLIIPNFWKKVVTCCVHLSGLGLIGFGCNNSTESPEMAVYGIIAGIAISIISGYVYGIWADDFDPSPKKSISASSNSNSSSSSGDMGMGGGGFDTSSHDGSDSDGGGSDGGSDGGSGCGGSGCGGGGD